MVARISRKASRAPQALAAFQSAAVASTSQHAAASSNLATSIARRSFAVTTQPGRRSLSTSAPSLVQATPAARLPRWVNKDDQVSKSQEAEEETTEQDQAQEETTSTASSQPAKDQSKPEIAQA